MKEEYLENLRRVLLEFEVILGCSSMSIMLIIFLQTSFNQLSTYHITLWMQWESKSLPGLTLTHFLASSLLLPCGLSHTHTPPTQAWTLLSALTKYRTLVDPQQVLLIQLEREKGVSCRRLYSLWKSIFLEFFYEAQANESRLQIYSEISTVIEIIWCSGELLHIKNQRPNYVNQSFLNFSFPVCWMGDMMLYRKAFEKHEGLCKK